MRGGGLVSFRPVLWLRLIVASVALEAGVTGRNETPQYLWCMKNGVSAKCSSMRAKREMPLWPSGRGTERADTPSVGYYSRHHVS